MKDEEDQRYEHPIYGINWTGGVGRPAGIYWVNGTSRIAAHGSAAEACLLEMGAILMATLRFDGEQYERSHAGRKVERVAVRQFVQAAHG